MTIDHWLTIAIVISTLIAPSVPDLLKSRVHQPSAKPDMSHPKNLIQRIGNWLKKLCSSPWTLPLLVVGLAIISLHHDVNLAGPITRKDVMRISLDIGEIVFGCTAWFILGILQISRAFSEISKDHERMLYDHFTITKGIVGAIFPPPEIEDFEDYSPD